MFRDSTHPRLEFMQLRPCEQGARRALFDLEADVMEVIWDWKQGRILVREVLTALEGTRLIAYTTVMTTMDRLWKKGVLERASEGRAYAYWPHLSRDAFHRQIAAQVIDLLLPEATEPLLAAYIEYTAHADSAHLDRLEELIRSRRAEISRNQNQNHSSSG